MKLVKEIFREYDIRGIYNEEMDDETAYYIGRAYGTKLREFNKTKTVLAHDNRLSSPSLAENMIKGLVDTGIHVLDLGLTFRGSAEPHFISSNAIYHGARPRDTFIIIHFEHWHYLLW